jgi:hypothetical protein
MDGKLDGSLENYYRNSQSSEEANFREGKFGGPFVSYWDDGQLQKKGTYDVDRMCCEWFDLGGKPGPTIPVPRPRRRQLAPSPPPWHPAMPSYPALFCSSGEVPESVLFSH